MGNVSTNATGDIRTVPGFESGDEFSIRTSGNIHIGSTDYHDIRLSQYNDVEDGSLR